MQNTQALQKATITPICFSSGSHFSITGKIAGTTGLTLALIDIESMHSPILYSSHTQSGIEQLTATLSTDLADGFAGGSVIDRATASVAANLGDKSNSRYFLIMAAGQQNMEQLQNIATQCKSSTYEPTFNLPIGAQLNVSGAAKLTARGGYPWYCPEPLGRSAWVGYNPRTAKSCVLLTCLREYGHEIESVTIMAPQKYVTLRPEWHSNGKASLAWFESVDLGPVSNERIELWWSNEKECRTLNLIPIDLVSGESYKARFAAPLHCQVDIHQGTDGHAPKFGAISSYFGSGSSNQKDNECEA